MLARKIHGTAEDAEVAEEGRGEYSGMDFGGRRLRVGPVSARDVLCATAAENSSENRTIRHRRAIHLRPLGLGEIYVRSMCEISYVQPSRPETGCRQLNAVGRKTHFCRWPLTPCAERPYEEIGDL